MILGLDISTSITGATVLDKSGNMLYNESWDTRNKNKFPTLYQKANFVKNNLTEIKHQFNIEKIVIEQSLQSFRSGFSSAKTLSTLSRFNGIVSWLCYELYNIEPDMIAASSARKRAGLTIKRGENAKEKVFNFVVDNQIGFVVRYTRNGNLQPECYDRADSWIIAKAALLS
jgi:Holliday junction resolvasome RuvABC endonuclease subunit